MDYDSICINRKVESIDNLLDSIKEALGKKGYTPENNEIRKMFWKHDNWTCGDIWQAIVDKFND